jgi:anti-sigma28 factor (negative regulator of flagellin synthesis)
MLSSADKGEFKNRNDRAFDSSFRGKDRISDGRSKRAGRSGNSPPVREEKVEEAKRKKQNGEYDSEEVYGKIADRLIDLFGI